jgi:hypothetical protein
MTPTKPAYFSKIYYHTKFQDPTSGASISHITSLHGHHVSIINSRKMKIQKWGHLYWHYIHIKLHENPSTGSEVIRGTWRDDKTTRLASLKNSERRLIT